MGDRLVAVDDSNWLLPIEVRNAYLSDVQQRVNQGVTDSVANMPTVAQAVSDRLVPLTSDNAVAPLLDSATSTRTKLDRRYIVTAPPPSGGNDTVVLQQLLDLAQASNGTVRLREGDYIANLLTNQSFSQPRIVGAGKRQTSIGPADPSKPVIKMQGGSGSNSGGYLSDFRITNSSQTACVAGLELADVCDVHWDRLAIEGNLTEGIRFRVSQTNGFCEFNSGSATIDTSVVTAIRYMTSNTVQSSFHGSGLTGGVINTGIGPAVQIDNYAYPYNAPMDVTFFPHTANATLFRNSFTSIKPGFTGTLRMENQTGGVAIAADLNSGYVLFAGPIVVNTANSYLGKLHQVKKIYWKSDVTVIQYEPWQRYIVMASTPVAVDLLLQNGEAAHVVVNVTGPNYAAHYELSVWQNPFNPGGDVTRLSGRVYNNGTNAGDVQFSVQNYQLVLSNTAMASGYAANISIVHLGGNVAADTLRQ